MATQVHTTENPPCLKPETLNIEGLNMETLIHALELLTSHNPVARDDGRRLIASTTPRLLNAAEAVQGAVASVMQAQQALSGHHHKTPLERHISRKLAYDARAKAAVAQRLLREAIADYGSAIASEEDAIHTAT